MMRDTDAVPRAAAHQVLVYRVRGQYVLDNAELDYEDDQVLAANHVTVVDCRRDAPVTVELTIPSADAAHFTLRVTFTCTVNDPVAVVRNGVNAQSALASYLTSRSRIFQLGLKYDLEGVNEVRQDVSAQIMALRTLKPPNIDGMSVDIADIGVLTPIQLANLREAMRKEADAYKLQSTKSDFAHKQRISTQLSDHEYADLKNQNRPRAHVRHLRERTRDAHQEAAARSSARLVKHSWTTRRRTAFGWTSESSS